MAPRQVRNSSAQLRARSPSVTPTVVVRSERQNIIGAFEGPVGLYDGLPGPAATLGPLGPVGHLSCLTQTSSRRPPKSRP